MEVLQIAVSAFVALLTTYLSTNKRLTNEEKRKINAEARKIEAEAKAIELENKKKEASRD